MKGEQHYERNQNGNDNRRSGGDIDGVQTELTVDDVGCVTINISENPIYVVVD